MKFAIVIPARLASTRFPSKPLALIDGRPLIQHAVERVMGAAVSEVVVATDSAEIGAVAKDLGCSVFMSRRDHECGTDRIAEVAHDLDADFIINVQGDQLVTGAQMINGVIDQVTEGLELATLYTDIEDPAHLDDVNAVKVVVSLTGEIIYMSRRSIPYDRGDHGLKYYMQVGIYVFARQALLDFAALAPTQLERAEGVELLRALDHGRRLTGIYAPPGLRDVNVPGDIAAAESFIDEHPITTAGAGR